MSAQDLVAKSDLSGLVKLTHVIYLLHGFSAVMGLLGSAFIATAFLSGWPSLIAVGLNYLKRSEARASYLASHFAWQIRTFWFALVWSLVALGMAFTIIGLPFARIIAVLTGLWILYRIARGWLALTRKEAMPVAA